MAEKEYIEREAAFTAIKDEIDNYQPNPDVYSITPYEFVRRGLNIAYSIIKNQPTADVQKVRHGKWEDNAEDVYWGNHFTRKHCSECGNKPEYREGKNSYVLSNYCRNCGAKMDKE